MGRSGSRHTVGLILGALALGAAAAACSAGPAAKSVSLRPSASTAANGISPTTAAGASPTTGATTPPALAPTTSTTAGHVATSGTTATTRPRSTTTTPSHAAATTLPASTGPAPAAPGHYVYDLVGTSGPQTVTFLGIPSALSVASTNTLTVSSSGAGAEQWTEPSITTNVVFNGAGVYLTSEAISAISTTCTFSTPVASPPWPLAAGKSFTGTAACNGGTSLSLSGLVGSATTLSVGGQSVSTYQVTTTMTVSGTTVKIVETDWYAPSVRLPVKSNVSINGGASGYSISSNATYALTSLIPA